MALPKEHLPGHVNFQVLRSLCQGEVKHQSLMGLSPAPGKWEKENKHKWFFAKQNVLSLRDCISPEIIYFLLLKDLFLYEVSVIVLFFSKIILQQSKYITFSQFCTKLVWSLKYNIWKTESVLSLRRGRKSLKILTHIVWQIRTVCEMTEGQQASMSEMLSSQCCDRAYRFTILIHFYKKFQGT